MSNYNFCLGCMAPATGAAQCPKCGYIDGTPQSLPALAPGTKLADRYVVGTVISQNGEGITYIAMDMKTEHKITVREFLPRELCVRTERSDAIVIADGCNGIYNDYLSDFIEIHRAVGRISEQPAIVPLIDLFECNNTAYAVYKYVQGKPLSELVRRAKRLTWEEARPIFMPLITALVSAQKIGLVHFGISPETIIMNHNGELMLGEFGIPDARCAETDIDASLNDGYSALEQYSADGEKGKWTDVYSIAAVILYALTGKRPPDAVSRSYESRLNVPTSIAGEIPAYVLSAIAKAMQINVDNRIGSMEQLRNELAPRRDDPRPASAAAPVRPQQPKQTAPAPRPSAPRSSQPQQKQSNEPWYKKLSQFQYWLLTTCIAMIVLGTIGVIIFFNVRDKLSDDKPTSSVTYKEDVPSASTVVSGTDKTFVVPDLRGQSWEDVRHNDQYMGMLEFMEKAPEYSSEYKVGQVMAQSIEPNTLVKPGTPIAITVSLGSETCAVPNIIGMTVSEADQELSAAGLCMGSQVEEYNDSVGAGRVISIENTSVGEHLKRGDAVNIKVSLGREG